MELRAQIRETMNVLREPVDPDKSREALKYLTDILCLRADLKIPKVQSHHVLACVGIYKKFIVTIVLPLALWNEWKQQLFITYVGFKT